MYNQRYHHHHHPPPPNHHFPPPPPRPTKLFGVTLKVGSREFLGQGATRQLARHQAATKALVCLRHLDAIEADADPTSPSTTMTTQQPDESTAVASPAIEESPALGTGRRMSSQEAAVDVCGTTALSSPGPDHHYAAPGASTSSSPSPPATSYAPIVPSVVSFIDPVLRSMQDLTVDDDDDDDGCDDKENDVDHSGNDLKSEISLVHEITLKRRLSVDFHVVKESGPPHMRVYVTRCDVTGPAQPAVWPPATQSPAVAAAAIKGATTTTDNHQLLLKTEAEGNGKKVSWISCSVSLDR